MRTKDKLIEDLASGPSANDAVAGVIEDLQAGRAGEAERVLRALVTTHRGWSLLVAARERFEVRS